MMIERERINREQIEAKQRVASRCDRFYQNIQQYAYRNSALQHLYVLRKKIIPLSARVARSLIVLAVRDVRYQIQSMQFIKPNGFKQFKAGGAIKGGMIWLSPPLDNDYSGVIRLCEGWATGCTIAEITQQPVVCTLNASNMVNVAKLLVDNFPKATLLICADNDCWGANNAGAIAAAESVMITRNKIFYPEFKDSHEAKRPTDFNDLFLLEGFAETRKQLTIVK
jgi:putative DNA primase/helicase